MMKWMILIVSLVMTMFCHNKSPLTQALLLIGLSIWMGLVVGMNLTLWLFALIVLIFSSGMMVMFLYLTTLSSQDTNKTQLEGIMLLVVIITPSLILSNSSSTVNQISIISSNYSGNNQVSVLLICLYLLITLLCVFKYSQSFKGSLLVSKFI